jgi:hypothetical protein
MLNAAGDEWSQGDGGCHFADFLAVGWACEEPLNLSGWKGGQRDIDNGRRVALLLPLPQTKKEGTKTGTRGR